MWKLISRTFLLLIFLLLVLSASFLGVAWGSDALQLPRFLKLPAQGGTPTSLIINVFPEDATIMLNDRLYNPQNILVPGDYLITVSHDNFFSVEETIRVHPNQKTQRNIHLMPISSTQEVSRFATSIGWNDQNKLYYLDFSEGKIHNWTDDTSYDVVGVDVIVHELIFLPDGEQAVVVTSDGPESPGKFGVVNFQAGKITDLSLTGFVSLGQNGILWGINSPNDDREKPIWKLVFGGKPQFFPLEHQEWAIYVEQLLVDSTEHWLAIESPMGIGVWEIASGKLVTTFENASAPVWVQNPQLGLAYLSANQSLNFAQADLSWSSVTLLSNVQSPLVRMPSGSDIVFTRYNPFEGGTSFWAVDTTMMGVRLLSEAKTESGRVVQFSISPDGKKIAFVNQKNILFLITLEP